MKVHEGRCSDHALCTRTHGYKCRACNIWFQTNDDTFLDMGQTIFTFPFWPYCSLACWTIAIYADPAFPRDRRTKFTEEDWGSYAIEFITPETHQEFNEIMTTMKEL